jgi:hypothetical protein
MMMAMVVGGEGRSETMKKFDCEKRGREGRASGNKGREKNGQLRGRKGRKEENQEPANRYEG